MDGIFKKIVLVLICSTLMCCNNSHNEEHNKLLNEARLKEKELIREGRKLIQQNSSILIDSVSAFDVKSLDPKVKEKELTIGLVDSIYYKNRGMKSDKNFITFKLHKADFVNFKSEYKLHLIKKQNGRILVIIFSNFIIDNNNAKIRVKKVFGISMMEATFYFEKINDVWVFKKKQVFGSVG